MKRKYNQNIAYLTLVMNDLEKFINENIIPFNEDFYLFVPTEVLLTSEQIIYYFNPDIDEDFVEILIEEIKHILS